MAFKHEPEPPQSRGGRGGRRKPARYPGIYGALRGFAAGAACLLAVGCGALTGERSGAPLGSIGHVVGFIGGVATEGPRATLIARNMLSAGGTAADAAVAAAFMLTVTYPVAASVAGGGRCLVFDGEREKVKFLDFPVRPPVGGGTVPVPGLVRGLALLHADHGRLPWSQLVSPAEQVARFGERVTRAYSRVLQEPGIVDRLSEAARTALAVGADGRLLDEGAPLAQPELASSLSRIRGAGAGDFYSGLLARSYIDAVAALGGRITMDDMRGYRIETGVPGARPFDAFEVYFDNAGTGRQLALWDAAVDRRVALLDDTADLTALPAALMQTLPSGPADVPPGAALSRVPGTTTIAVVDRRGQAVACSLEIGAPFGSGLYAQTIGTLLPSMPGAAGPDRSGSSLAVMGSQKSWRAKGAFGAAAGLPGAAPAVLLETMLPILTDSLTADQAMAAPRFAPTPGGAAMAVEPAATANGMDPKLRQAIEATGRPVVVTERIGRVNVAYCQNGIPVDDAEECAFVHDPRGFGLGAGHGF